jgi:hypothetical protein
MGGRDTAMHQERRPLYEALEKARSSRLLVYFTGDRRGLETQLHPEVLDIFINHLDKIGDVPKLSLYLYTRGGVTMTAWTLVNLLRHFCRELEVIAPSKCWSAGTLICLGADRIVMTRQATLGPIDPSVDTPLNPIAEGAVPNQRTRVRLSVEGLDGFVRFAKEEVGMKQGQFLGPIITKLMDQVHALAIGEAYRVRAQSRMLGKRLLERQMMGQEEDIERVLRFLCSESGSHDYTIDRREAKNELKLKVDQPTDAEYRLVKDIYDSISDELCLTKPFDGNAELGGQSEVKYAARTALIESLPLGCDVHIHEGRLKRHVLTVKIPGQPQPLVQPAVENQIGFIGWRAEHV